MKKKTRAYPGDVDVATFRLVENDVGERIVSIILSESKKYTRSVGEFFNQKIDNRLDSSCVIKNSFYSRDEISEMIDIESLVA